MTGLAQAAGPELDLLLADADRALARGYPGDRPGRQPVHTAYVPADRFGPDLPGQWGRQALQALHQTLPQPSDISGVMGLPLTLAADVKERVTAKLAAEPIEDLRLDFEDGYGDRGDGTEDADARAAAAALAAQTATAPMPPFCGVRCKSLEPATRRRAIATLDIFIGELTANGPLPSRFVITLPKVTSPDQVQAMSLLCARLEQAHGLADGQLRYEIQAETPQLILGADGAATVARCLQEGGPRLTGVHYGTYDYSAALGIAAQYQSMEHPAADHARAVLQVAAAGTGVRLSDGSTNVLPVGSPDDMRAAWRLHSRLVRRSLERGFYQGWDLHPAQLVSRYAATYGFFRTGLPAACERLAAYSSRAAGGVLEEPATARALAGFLIRGLDCGAVGADEVEALSGLGRATLTALSRAGLSHRVADKGLDAESGPGRARREAADSSRDGAGA